MALIDIILNGSAFNTSFNVFILVCFGGFVYLWSKKKLPTLTSHGPNLLPTLGILGTFIGILLGLREFDVANIDGSIPGLLDGMKLAFSTSVLGMVTSLILKILYSLRQDNSLIKDEVTANDLYIVLNDIRTRTGESIQVQKEHLNGIRTAITGNEDSSLLTQIQKLRTNFSDHLTELKDSFNSFADKVTENNSKALIEALEAVIKDFNSKINEQFGENFKHLNQAVQAMLTWQQEYKGQVESLTEAFKMTSNGVKEIEGSIRSVKDHLSLIPETMRALQDLIKGFNAQTEDLGNHLKAFQELKDKAVEAFPVIQENLESMTGKLSTEMEKNGKAITDMLMQFTEEMRTSTRQNLESVTEGLNSYTLQIKEHATEQQRELKESAQSIQENIESMTGTLSAEMEKNGKSIAEMLTQFAEEMSATTHQNLETVTAGFVSYTQQMKDFAIEQQKGLKESAQSIQENLESLTGELSAEMEKSGKNVATVLTRFAEDVSASTRINLEALKEGLNSYTEQLRDFAKEQQNEMKENTQNIQENLESLTEKLSSEIEKNGKALSTVMTKFAEDLSATTRLNLDVVTEGLNSYTKQVREFAVEQQKELKENTQSMRQGFEQALKGTNDLLKASYEKFDEEMKNEIERTIRHMGSLLGALSEKFVKDYDKFASTLKEWVELVK